MHMPSLFFVTFSREGLHVKAENLRAQILDIEVSTLRSTLLQCSHPSRAVSKSFKSQIEAFSEGEVRRGSGPGVSRPYSVSGNKSYS